VWVRGVWYVVVGGPNSMYWGGPVVAQAWVFFVVRKLCSEVVKVSE